LFDVAQEHVIADGNAMFLATSNATWEKIELTTTTPQSVGSTRSRRIWL
jgi:hypothetical protein